VNGDTSTRENETFNVVLSTPTYAVLADDLGVGTITTTQHPQSRSMTFAVTEANAHRQRGLTVTSACPTAAPVHRRLRTSDGTRLQPGD